MTPRRVKTYVTVKYESSESFTYVAVGQRCVLAHLVVASSAPDVEVDLAAASGTHDAGENKKTRDKKTFNQIRPPLLALCTAK